MLLALLSALLGFLPGFAWLAFYLTEDPRTESKRLILFTFLAGIAFGFLAIIPEKLLGEVTKSIDVGGLSVISLLCLAFIEEIMKFGATYLAIYRTPEMNDPIDPMIYMIVAALGFATLENIGTLAAASMNGPLSLASFFQTLSLRFIGATLLHTLTAGIVGYHWSLGMAKKQTARFLAVGIGLATLVHTVFNYLILNLENISYTIIFLLFVGLFVLNDFDILKAKEKPE
jgi:RsiW-degrading membrane proteinase PrsW (M82 family)